MAAGDVMRCRYRSRSWLRITSSTGLSDLSFVDSSTRICSFWKLTRKSVCCAQEERGLCRWRHERTDNSLYIRLSWSRTAQRRWQSPARESQSQRFERSSKGSPRPRPNPAPGCLRHGTLARRRKEVSPGRGSVRSNSTSKQWLANAKFAAPARVAQLIAGCGITAN